MRVTRTSCYRRRVQCMNAAPMPLFDAYHAVNVYEVPCEDYDAAMMRAMGVS